MKSIITYINDIDDIDCIVKINAAQWIYIYIYIYISNIYTYTDQGGYVRERERESGINETSP